MNATRSARKPRIASLAPNVTSILLALGARRQLVGVSKWCADVAHVGALPRLGDCWNLDSKPLIALRPDIIIGSVPFRAEVVADLLQLPVTFVAINPRSLADIYANIRLLGSLAARPLEAAALIDEMQKAFAKVHARASHARKRTRVYCEAWPRPRISSPPWVKEIVEIAGGRMVVPPGEKIADADVARAKPEVIVIAWTATGHRATTGQSYANAAWQDVPALCHRRIVVIRDEWLNTPGPPLMRGAQALLEALHPELPSKSETAKASKDARQRRRRH
jgi:iron complex transport system substrate-binding protein